MIDTHGLKENVTDTCRQQYSKVAIFCVQSRKNYTGQKIFTQTPSVVSVTNMRYGCGPYTSHTDDIYEKSKSLGFLKFKFPALFSDL